MATKHQVIALHKANPEWTSRQIADALGCGAQYVSKTAKRNNLTLGSARPNQSDPNYLRAEARRLIWRAEKILARARSLEAQP